ncbi:MAG: hypothetical protein AAGG81_02580 [Chlamydiota bacterium]
MKDITRNYFLIFTFVPPIFSRSSALNGCHDFAIGFKNNLRIAK